MMRICIFAGARDGNNPQFIRDAALLGRSFAAINIEVIYGGASCGLMGAFSNSLFDAGGKIHSIIPEVLRNVPHAASPKTTTTTFVADLFDRKKMMFDAADAFVVLPGGIGTLDEALEVAAASSLSLSGAQNKHLLFLNTASYWDPFISLIAHIRDTEFCSFGDAMKFEFFSTVPGLMSYLSTLKHKI